MKLAPPPELLELIHHGALAFAAVLVAIAMQSLLRVFFLSSSSRMRTNGGGKLSKGGTKSSKSPYEGLLVREHDRGVFQSMLQNSTVVLMPVSRIYEFLESLEVIMGHAASRRYSYNLGYSSGTELALETRNMALGSGGRISGSQLLYQGPEMLSTTGWGRGVIDYDEKTGEIVWTFEGGTPVGIAAKERGFREAPACAFYEGLLAGWCNLCLDKDLEFVETECVSTGHQACAFRSRPMLR